MHYISLLLLCHSFVTILYEQEEFGISTTQYAWCFYFLSVHFLKDFEGGVVPSADRKLYNKISIETSLFLQVQHTVPLSIPLFVCFICFDLFNLLLFHLEY